jgi:hypothetical protein
MSTFVFLFSIVSCTRTMAQLRCFVQGHTYLTSFCLTSITTAPILTENKMLEALSSCEPEMLLASHDSSLSDPEYHIMSTLSELYDRELVGIISWAKQIPGMCNGFI